jgi:uncharacterized membrane protein YfcA
MEIIGYAASICIGLILGILGGGGSILSIPILVYLFHIDVVLASAYSLFIVGTTSLVGAVTKYKEHTVNFRSGLLFGIPSIVSIFVTRKWIVSSIPDIVWQGGDFILSKRLLLLGLFAVLMVLASVSMVRETSELDNDDERFMPVLLLIQGLLIGFLTGLVGAGGGFLIVPALVLLTGLTFKTAVGTSLFIIAISSLTGFLGDLINYRMDWTFLLIITALAIFGILVGNQLTHKISSLQLRKIFGWFILIVGCGMLIQEIAHS